MVTDPVLTFAEDSGKVTTINFRELGLNRPIIVDALKADRIVMIHDISPQEADAVVYDVADYFGLSNNLRLQAALAGSVGHRVNIGKYFMSVNKRLNYRFIPPHSEGSSTAGMQIAAFYCYENTTDGGETILMNVAGSEIAWSRLREKVVRARLSRSAPLTASEIGQARMRHRLTLPRDFLKVTDQILEETPSVIPGLTVVDALAKVEKCHSEILARDVYVYWDTVGSIDLDSAREYELLLRQSGLLKEPAGALDLLALDDSGARRIWRSGLTYRDLFGCKIVCKLRPRQFIIFNNTTWTHAANNWTPESGMRKISASFA